MDDALGSTVLATPAEPLSLRICGGSRDGQVVRLSGPKCTIGADPRCTLRLHGPGIRPVYCLILRGHGSAVVRRWSPDTLINGGAFEDAALAPGDRLQCGPALFQVEPAAGDGPRINEAPLVDSVRCPTIVMGPPPSPATPAEVTPAALTQADALREQLQAEREAWNSERQAWESERQTWQTQRRDWEAQHRAADETLDQQRELVERLLAKAHNQLSTLNRDMDAWHRQRPSEEEEKLREETARIAEERAALEKLHCDLEAKVAEVEARERRLTDLQAVDEAMEPLPHAESSPESYESPTSDDSPPAANARDSSNLESGRDGEAEPSVEQYMADLLRRVGGRPASEAGAAAAPAVTMPDPSSKAGVRKTTPPAAASTPPAPANDLRNSTVPAAPRRAPETTSDLASLREVANLHTQAALHTHGKHRAVYAAWGKFAVSLTGLAVGVAILLWGKDTVAMTCTAWAAIVIGLAWSVQLSFAMRNLVRANRPSQPAPHGGATTAESPQRAPAAVH